jgi:hypothetical protein
LAINRGAGIAFFVENRSTIYDIEDIAGIKKIAMTIVAGMPPITAVPITWRGKVPGRYVARTSRRRTYHSTRTNCSVT